MVCVLLHSDINVIDMCSCPLTLENLELHVKVSLLGL